jgi:hypothetical protein
MLPAVMLVAVFGLFDFPALSRMRRASRLYFCAASRHHTRVEG